jgi:hypothetical protein
MDPLTSADAALRWLNFKGTVHDKKGNPVSYLGNAMAIQNYNGNNRVYPREQGFFSHKYWYVYTVLVSAAETESDRSH